MKNKALHLLPMPLYEGMDDIPEMTRTSFRGKRVFIAERARTLRRFLSRLGPEIPIDEVQIFELDKHAPEAIVRSLRDIFLLGHEVGLVSEAGTPCIADPGYRVVSWAHQQGISVLPFPGPSSLMLALMASGFYGQQFGFHGYLNAKRNLLKKDLLRLESLSTQSGAPQICIEAPYRNKQWMEEALQTFRPDTQLHVSTDLCSPSSWSLTRDVHSWRQLPPPDLHKRPSVFIIFTPKGT